MKTKTKTDDFDPQAPFVDSWGTVYENFVARLKGEPWPGENCNERIADLRKKGRSQAFCQIYAEAYRCGPFPAPKDLVAEASWHAYALGRANGGTTELPDTRT